MKIHFWFCSCSHYRPFSDVDTHIPGEVKNRITHVLHVRTNELQYSLHHVSVYPRRVSETTNDCNVTSHMPHISTKPHQSSFYDIKYNQKKMQSWRIQDKQTKIRWCGTKRLREKLVLKRSKCLEKPYMELLQNKSSNSIYMWYMSQHWSWAMQLKVQISLPCRDVGPFSTSFLSFSFHPVIQDD